MDRLVEKGILREEKYLYRIHLSTEMPFVEEADSDSYKNGRSFIKEFDGKTVNVDKLKSLKEARLKHIGISALLSSLEEREEAECIEVRYDFKNTKISTGLNGINRIFLPSSKVYPTLVASDTNDFVADIDIEVSGRSAEEYKRNFMEKVYLPGHYRRISKEEACRIQGFPMDFELPQSRARWMKLIGNSVAVSMIGKLVGQIVATGVFDEADFHQETAIKAKGNPTVVQNSLFDVQN